MRRLVLAATGPGVVGLGGIPGSPRAMLALATRRRYRSPDYYRRVAGALYGGMARTDPDALLHGSIARFSQTPSLGGYLGQLYAISFWTGIPWLWRLRQPTLVLTGDDDPIIPVLNGRILASCLPNAELQVVARGGHLFLLERPDRKCRPGREIPAGGPPSRKRKSPMTRTHIAAPADLLDLVGRPIGVSAWHEISQDRVNMFADATGDRQWIHVDPARAAAGPFGGPIAHGYLTLALAPLFISDVLVVDRLEAALNYGLNKVRFPAPVPVGSRLRGAVTLRARAHGQPASRPCSRWSTSWRAPTGRPVLRSSWRFIDE